MDSRSAEKALINGALEQFSVPGEPGFPLNQAFEAPRDRQDAETLRGYMSQVRQELAVRLHQRLYEDGVGPSKVRGFVHTMGLSCAEIVSSGGSAFRSGNLWVRVCKNYLPEAA